MAAGSQLSWKKRILVFLDAIRPAFLRLRRKYEVDESFWLIQRWRSFSRRVFPTLRRAALSFSRRAPFMLRRTAFFFKWGRVPKAWELSFVDRMKKLEEAGLTFDEVLRSTLPQFLGEDPSRILRSWVGKKARRNPERFARSVSELFGASARSVLGSIEMFSDEKNMLEKKAPKEPPYQSLLEAIQRSEAGMTVAQPNKPQGKN